ncbi:hypothetical protein LEMLEM_LOCUS17637, partial [Lemmus lemmus]
NTHTHAHTLGARARTHTHTHLNLLPFSPNQLHAPSRPLPAGRLLSHRGGLPGWARAPSCLCSSAEVRLCKQEPEPETQVVTRASCCAFKLLSLSGKPTPALEGREAQERAPPTPSSALPSFLPPP